MQSAVPLLRSANAGVTHAPSNIPHLKFHILQRRSLRVQTNQDRVGRYKQHRRDQSTLSHAEALQINSDNSLLNNKVKDYIDSHQAVGVGTHDRAFPSKRKLEQLLKHSNLFEILQDGVPDRILSALLSDSIGVPFIREAPDHFFNKALLALDPDYFIEPYKNAHRHVQKSSSKSPLQTFKSIDERLATFAQYLDHIVLTRRENGKKLDLEASRQLLKWAGSMGDENLAHSVLRVVMPEDNVQPDLESYNHYCRALVWSNAFGSRTKYSLRILPRDLEIRGSQVRPPQLQGFRTANSAKGIQGIRGQVLDVFKECLEIGQPADESTFVNVMLAMGREADLAGVKSILKSVWNIDVDLLGTYDEEELESPTFYDEGHHLRPSQELLFAVVHIFGSNNDAHIAWLLMDFISRNYNLPVSEQVWMQLFEWIFVLALRRSRTQRRKGYGVGRIPQETLVHMFDTMVDEPHNLKPTPIMHYLLSRSWRDKRHLGNATSQIKKLQNLVDRQHHEIRRTQEQFLDYIRDSLSTIPTDQPHHNAFATFEFYEIRRKFNIQYLNLQCGLQLLKRAISMNLFQETDWAGSGKLTNWERRSIPRLVETFAAYVPSSLVYRTQTGTVELSCGHSRYTTLMKRFRLDYRTLNFIHNALDIEDQVQLNSRMQILLDVIHSTKKYCFHCDSTSHTDEACKMRERRGGGSWGSARYSNNAEQKAAGPTSEGDGDEILVLSKSIIDAAEIEKVTAQLSASTSTSPSGRAASISRRHNFSPFS